LIPAPKPGFFVQMTEQEKKFIDYWQKERQNKKKFLRRLSIGLPAASIGAAVIFANFISGWYKRADAALNADSSVILVVLVALAATVAFITVFSAHHQWDRNEASYQELVHQQSQESTGHQQ
jgi:hypothetical protein